jgi:hypothetical protein
MVSRKCWRVEVLASEVLVLIAPLFGLYTEEGADGGRPALYISDDPFE